MRHATGNHEHRRLAGRLALFLNVADTAKIGIDLLRRLLANVAGVEDDEIGIVEVAGRRIAPCRQRLHHAVAVIDVHLAAKGLEEDLLGPGVRRHCSASLNSVSLNSRVGRMGHA